jgi:fumarate reductase iron-sulfur subunit
MTVNGQPRWTCRAHVSRVEKNGHIRIAPMRNMPIVKDLACDMTEFFDKWKAAQGQFKPSDPKAKEFARIEPTGANRQVVDAAIECIGCGVCYSACDLVEWDRNYLGPAALNRAWTLVNDTRDADAKGHLAAVALDSGCHVCHSHQSCATYCPQSLNPTASIAGLKRAVFGAALKGAL